MTNLMNVEVKMKAKEKLSMKLLIMRRRNKKKANPFSAKRNIVSSGNIRWKDEFCKNHKKTTARMEQYWHEDDREWLHARL